MWNVTSEETSGGFRTGEELAISESPGLGSQGHLKDI